MDKGITGLVVFIATVTMVSGAATNSPAPAAPAAPAFSFEVLRQRARDLAAKEYHPETNPELPDFLKNLTFDQYQDIRFRAEQAPWANERLRFGIQFFHRGSLYQEPVRIHLLEGGQVRDLQFSTGQFDYGKNRFPKPVPEALDFAGLRVVYRTNAAAKWDEVASFVGASYFRLVGLHQRFGAAGRGLTIDTGEPGGEEFPRFSEFWIEKPDESAETLQLFALLDSPSVAGAYRFVIHPGEDTSAEVEASLFVRKEGKKLGFAPLTSMFLMGENRTRFVPDYRPEVHDSDGLLLKTGTEDWVWRPLVNPDKKHHISTFPTDNLDGFGLLQRDRDFHNYEDLGARYDLRPGLWVKPQSKWGAGVVELVEIPSPAEWNDNIVAYWVPGQKLTAGQEFRLAYTLTASLGEPELPFRLRVQATRINPERDKNPPRFLVDFVGDTLPSLPANAPVEAKVQASRGEVRNLVTQTNDVTGGWRAFFDLAGAGAEPVELRLWLQSGNKVVSESWVYHFESP